MRAVTLYGKYGYICTDGVVEVVEVIGKKSGVVKVLVRIPRSRAMCSAVCTSIVTCVPNRGVGSKVVLWSGIKFGCPEINASYLSIDILRRSTLPITKTDGISMLRTPISNGKICIKTSIKIFAGTSI